jgi:hypothetical protein
LVPILKKVLIFLILGILVWIFYNFNPYQYPFPRCPVNFLTGLKCPGCGSQRALYFLLHFQIVKAMHENGLMVLSIPYLLIGFLFEWFHLNVKCKKSREIMIGRGAIKIILVLIVIFTVVRNI